jgi:hypothetical protein
MTTRTVIMFPYSGFDSGDTREKVFWKIIGCCQEVTKAPPIVVLNRDTLRRGKAEAFLSNPKTTNNEIFIHHTWSVDTCQMWLSGWGQVIDHQDTLDDDRIVQVPGDIDTVSEGKEQRGEFFENLGSFIDIGYRDIFIGDFSSGEMFNAKELIDLYGTYALMANWFPDIAQQIRSLKLNKPRSEFLNIKVGTLKELLVYRKFAYEQTLNMLIRSWDFDKSQWKYTIKVEPLGILKDDSGFRQYRDCLDQIERTERMLKLLWREINDPQRKEQSQDDKSKYEDFITLYDRLDRRSTSIRENSRIIIRNMLGLEPKQ